MILNIYYFRALVMYAILGVTQSNVWADSTSPIVSDPIRVLLTGPDARQTLLFQQRRPNGLTVDLTQQAILEVETPRIVEVNGTRIKPLRDGKTNIIARIGNTKVVVPIEVNESQRPRDYHFVNDIEPLFGRFGCNTSGCHGKAEGQNGFKLSVFGFDPDGDFAALVQEGRGRRIFPAAPARSLLLSKAAGLVPHGGGIRIPADSEAFELLRGWIAAGCPVGNPSAATVKSVRVEPAERLMNARTTQQLRVIAIYSDGSEKDVTSTARFQTNNEAVASVDSNGLVTIQDVPGEAALMASFANESAIFRAMVPQQGVVELDKKDSLNFIDDRVAEKLAKLQIARSPICDDATYFRRVYLDVIGTLPTAQETRNFLTDRATDKRARLVDTLLNRTEYADLWAQKWSDVLRVDRQTLGHQRAYEYYRWIRESIRNNTHFDRFVHEIVTAEGPIDEKPAANFYRVSSKPGDSANTISQVFLGIRLACAECHHHPYDRWGQDDYHAMAAFFSPLAFKRIASMDALITVGEAVSKHPRSGATVFANSLGVVSKKIAKGDRREELAEWMTNSENPYFAKNIVNRYWAHFMGRGLVEPIDDMRATNPPTNPELLDQLAADFVKSKYDVKQLIRTICTSRTYQTSSSVLSGNQKDEQNYSRMLLKRPSAEVLLDMISQSTGVPEKFDAQPIGTRALEIWDSKSRHSFLKQFGRPIRSTACECERNSEPSIAQVLNLLNGETINDKLRHELGTVATLSREVQNETKLIEGIYLTVLNRYPSDAELSKVTSHLARRRDTRRQALEDTLWALLNTKEFLFNH